MKPNQKVMTGAFLGVYTETEKDVKIIFSCSWEGRIGFFGGFVGDENKNESKEIALSREAKEELNFEVRPEEIKIEYNRSYEKNWGILDLYFAPLKVEFNTFKNILANFHKAEHYLYETMGYFVLTIKKEELISGKYKETKPYVNFVKNNLATDVKEELDYLLDKVKSSL